MNRKLKLYFKDANNGSKTVTIDYPKDSYEASEVEGAMTAMIEADVIRTKNGNIAVIDKAELETVSKDTVIAKQA